ncbi:MAG: hypothetical protein R2817_03380 [Flavobacteriales bacterium]
MSTLQRLLHCDGRTDRLTYQRNIALLAVAKTAVDLITLSFAPDIAVPPVALAWLNPFLLVEPWLEGAMPFTICLSTFAFYTGLVWNGVHRLRDAGWRNWLGALTVIPFAGMLFGALIGLIPTQRRTVWDLV